MSTTFTRLQAVNIMLSVVAQAPVETLGTSTNVYVSTAENILDEVIRELQAFDWWFAREKEVVLSPDGDGYIAVGNNIVSLDDSYGYYNLTIRDGFVYDLDNHTDVFSNSFTVDIICALEWDSLPLAAKNYAVKRATRILNGRLFRDSQVAREAAFDEQRAWEALVVENSRQADYNLMNNPELARAMGSGRSVVDWGSF